MKANVDYYSDWFVWLERRTTQLVKKNPLSAMVLVSDTAELVKVQIELMKSLAGVLKGSKLSILGRIIRWASENADPLENTRNLMDAMRKKHGEVDGKS